MSDFEDQETNAKRWAVLIKLARDAGFDDDALAYTEFCLRPLFELVAEECAKQAELQARNYTGENNESAGCYGSATAIRVYAQKLGVPGE